MKKLLIALGIAIAACLVWNVASASTANITQLSFTSASQTILAGDVSSVLTVQTQNAGGTSEQLNTSGTVLELKSSSPTGEFSSNATTWHAVGTLGMNNTTANKNFFYKDSTPGTHTLTITAQGQTWTSAVQTIVVNPIVVVPTPAPVLTFTLPTRITVPVRSELAPSSPEGVGADSSAIEALIAGITPLTVNLTNTGDAATSPVRINPLNAGSGIQLWVEAPDANWYDVNVIGYGEALGMILDPGFDNTVNVYPVSMVAGDYPLHVDLVLAEDSSDVQASADTLVKVQAAEEEPGDEDTEDVTAPVITLHGDASMSVFTSNPFVDPGAEVSDDVDAEIVPVVTGSVNLSVPGVYTLSYDAEDSSGNPAETVIRTVLVKAAGNGSGGGSPSSGQVLGAFTEAEGRGSDASGQVLGTFFSIIPPSQEYQIAFLKNQLAGLMQELLGLLQAQLAAVIAAQGQ